MRKGRCGRRVGQIVGRDIYRLNTRDRAALCGGDTLLKCAHLGSKRRLISDRRRHSAEQRGDLASRLSKAEDIIYKEQHVLTLNITKILRNGETGERDTHSRSGRLVHLTVDKRGILDNPRLGHFVV